MIELVMATVFSIGVEALHDKTEYHFDNPSSWDTPTLVPHFFEQRYSANKQMLLVRARSARWELEAGTTPVGSARGSDYDTFFQSSGDIVVHGYTDDVRMRSWRAAEYVHAGGWRVGVVYSRDQSQFPPTFATTTHTHPPSVVSTFTSTRESTTSDVLEARIGFERNVEAGFSPPQSGLKPGPTFLWGVDIAPVTLARLTTYLPDKYRNPIRFSARAFSASSHVAAEWRFGRGSIALGGELTHVWRYVRRSSFVRQQSGVSITLGIR